jgi:hypothetical protein
VTGTAPATMPWIGIAGAPAVAAIHFRARRQLHGGISARPAPR